MEQQQVLMVINHAEASVIVPTASIVAHTQNGTDEIFIYWRLN